MYMHSNAKQHRSQNRQNAQEDHRHLRVDGHSHDHREQDHKRSADCQTDQQLVRILHVGHIRCHTGYQGRCGEFINIRKGEILNLEIHILS